MKAADAELEIKMSFHAGMLLVYVEHEVMSTDD